MVYYYLLRLLAENRGADMLLRAAVARLRCKRCGDGPESVALLETNLTDGKGRRLGWRVELSA